MTGNFRSLFSLREAQLRTKRFTSLGTNWQNFCIWFPWGCLHHFEDAVGSLQVRPFLLLCSQNALCCSSQLLLIKLNWFWGWVWMGSFLKLDISQQREEKCYKERWQQEKGVKSCVKKILCICSSLERKENGKAQRCLWNKIRLNSFLLEGSAGPCLANLSPAKAAASQMVQSLLDQTQLSCSSSYSRNHRASEISYTGSINILALIWTDKLLSQEHHDFV